MDISDDQPPTGTVDFRFPRFAEASPMVKVSDHYPVFFDLP